MDGLNFKVSGNLLEDFKVDSNGMFIPLPDRLLMNVAEEKLRKQLNADTGMYDRLATIYQRTDVLTTDNPLGNTPTLGVGFKLIGKRPITDKISEKVKKSGGKSQNLANAVAARERKIEEIQMELINVHEKCKELIKDARTQLLHDVEGDQMLTGGGFDNNQIGGATKDSLKFIYTGAQAVDIYDNELGANFVRGCIDVKEELHRQGLEYGSLSPQGASVVRMNQENDGLVGFPAYMQSLKSLDQDVAKRLLIDQGVDVSELCGSQLLDKTTGEMVTARLCDAVGKIMDSKVFSKSDLVNIWSLLVRIQKHGFTYKDGKLKAKDGKTRSIKVSSAIPAFVESMLITPFNDKLKDLKISIMPSLQDKPTRVEMLKRQIKDAFQIDYDYLAADWSKYDAGVKGSMWATMIQLIVKPFYKAEYYAWVDAFTYLTTFKYALLDTNLTRLNPEDLAEAEKAVPSVQVKNYTLFGQTDGLLSGLKFTHVGGSLYGEALVHRAIPYCLQYEPIFGAQAGDDTLMGIPKSMIDLSSVEKTYDPIAAVAKKYNLDMNTAKQIWEGADVGEVVKVFLQDSYHETLDIWGIGSIFRPAAAVWYSERDKGLSISEQLLAEIARMNQGADNPFAPAVVEWWLGHEKYLGILFKEKGISAFNAIVASIGSPVGEIAKTIDVGSFSFSISKDDLEAGTLPILNVMSDVAAQMSFPSGDKAEYLREFEPEQQNTSDDESLVDDDSVLV